MMRIRFSSLIIVALALGGIARSVPAEETANLDPLVAKLTADNHDDARNNDSPFLTTLFTLSHNKSWKPFPYDRKTAFTSGRAVRYGEPRNAFVIVMLEPAPLVIPGPWSHDLLLLDDEGRLLDRVQCITSSRLSVEGKLTSMVLKEPEQDGATIVLRYTPSKAHENATHFSHDIIIDGKRHTFHWEDDLASWRRHALCRLSVKDGRFQILRPMVPRRNLND